VADFVAADFSEAYGFSMLIEQAVYTSAKTASGERYYLVAQSSGVTAADARELSAWGPGEGALGNSVAAVEQGSGGSSSVNFHPLPSGAACVGYSVAVESDRSDSPGYRAHTQCLIVPAEELARFANNPFALLRAARGQGALKVHAVLPACLEPIQLPGQSAAVDEGLLGELVDRWGPRHLAWLVQAALTADALVVVGTDKADWLVAGLLNCLPVECRPELSFATGMVYSQRRPYRLNAVVADEAECRRVGRQMGVTLLNLNDEPPADFEPTGWAGYLESAAQADHLADFAAGLGRRRAGLRISDLSWLATQLLDRLQAGSNAQPGNRESNDGNTVRPQSVILPPNADFSYPGPRLSDIRPIRYGSTDFPTTAATDYCQAHRAHPRLAKGLEGNLSSAGPALRIPGPSAMLAGSDHGLLEKLEHLDDLVFDTIGGRQPALDELTRLWPRTFAELPGEMLAESREQYLRYALSLWNSCQPDNGRDPQWAITALDVLSVIFSADC
jgi:hypothetical protein